jgi:hypothetical protein
MRQNAIFCDLHSAKGFGVLEEKRTMANTKANEYVEIRLFFQTASPERAPEAPPFRAGSFTLWFQPCGPRSRYGEQIQIPLLPGSC